MRFSRPSLSFVALLALPAAMLAAQPKEKFTGTTTVVAVEVPVQVLVDGRPVRGLTAADFEIVDGRQVREITGFEVVDLAQGAPAAAPAAAPVAPVAGRRHFLMLFDLSFSRPASIVKARAAARELITGSLHPSDLVAVATYSARRGPALLIGFTSDRRQVDLAIETMGLPQLVERSPDPLAVVLGNLRDQAQVPGAPPRRADAAVQEFLEDMERDEAATRLQDKGNEITSLTRGFADLARLMGNVRGRKHVVYLSEGFDSQVVSGTTDEMSRSAMSQAAESGELWKIDSEARFGSTRVANDLEQMLEEFRRADCAVQAVDIGGLEEASGTVRRRAQRDSLFLMAKDTGGQLFENFNELGQAMGRMLESTSVTYVLTFQPRDLELDGKYRRLKVNLKGGPEGARLVHRPGYYAPLPFEQVQGAARQLDTAQLLFGGEPGGSFAVGAVAASLPLEAGRAYVPVVFEVDGARLLAGRSGGELALDLYVYALDAAGGVHDFVAQNLRLDLSKAGEKLRAEGIKLFASLYLPPGDFTLRALARDGASGAYGLAEVPVSVPAFEANAPVALAPLFAEPMTRGLVSRAVVAGRRPDPPYPFLLGGEFFLPQGLPRVAAHGEARLCQLVFGLGDGPLEIRGEVLSSDGRPVGAAGVELVKRTATETPGLQRLEVALRAGDLAPGDYRLRLTVTGAGSGASVTGSTPFAVGSGG